MHDNACNVPAEALWQSGPSRCTSSHWAIGARFTVYCMWAKVTENYRKVEQQSVIETCFTALLDVALVLNAAELDGNMATTDMSGSYAVDVFGKLQVNVCFRCDNGLTSSQNIESWTL